MTSKEFTTWLRGFIAASHHYNLTPEAFDALKDELAKVNDNQQVTVPSTSVSWVPGRTDVTYSPIK